MAEMIRKVLLWIVWNVPLGRLAPWVFGLALWQKPSKAARREKRASIVHFCLVAPFILLLIAPARACPWTCGRQSAHASGGRQVLPMRFIRGRLVCARNVNLALAERGIHGTGSAAARSFLRWGSASGPVPGAVAVWSRGRRGGHVAIVHSVRPDGTVIYLNPSSRRQSWQIGPYNRRPIAFRRG